MHTRHAWWWGAAIAMLSACASEVEVGGPRAPAASEDTHAIDEGDESDAGDAGDEGASVDAGVVDEPAEPAPPAIPDYCANGPRAHTIDNCNPQVLPSTGDAHVDCVARVNQLRMTCQCLPPLRRWVEGEACADSMAHSDHDSGVAHGATDDGCDWGWAQNECPGWDSIDQCVDGCLQMMWDEAYGGFTRGHYENMTNPDYAEVACGFFDGNNGAWSVQNFR